MNNIQSRSIRLTTINLGHKYHYNGHWFSNDLFLVEINNSIDPNNREDWLLFSGIPLDKHIEGNRIHQVTTWLNDKSWEYQELFELLWMLVGTTNAKSDVKAKVEELLN